MRLWEAIRLAYVNQHDNWRLIGDKDLNSHSYNKETRRKQEQSQSRSRCWEVSCTLILPKCFEFLPKHDCNYYLSRIFKVLPKKGFSQHKELLSLSDKEEQKGVLFRKTISFVTKSDLKGVQNIPLQNMPNLTYWLLWAAGTWDTADIGMARQPPTSYPKGGH